jgi:TonB family protein
MELLHTDRSVSVRVDLDSATEDSVRAALRSVVAGSNEEFAALAPAHWQPFLRGETTTQNRHSPVDDKPQGGAMGDVDEPVRVNPAVAHTRLLREVKPAYPMIARQVRAKGAVMLRMVIGTDGRPKQVWIISPVGVGLDDAAVEAVRKWVYRPWVVDGRPLQVQTDVTVLYELKG